MSILPLDLQIPLVVVGNGGAYLEKIKKFAQAKQLEHKIIWIEKMVYEELPLLYRNASVFLYPSEYEGFGIPVIEALFSKVPVITSNVSCLPEAAGLNSFLVNPKSSEAIANAIYNTLTNSDLRQKMISEGVLYAHQNFAAKKVTTEVMDLYQSIV
jgi:glycosyltransferase involved in cell wall biosynthesis